jgi:hypothetical protein
MNILIFVFLLSTFFLDIMFTGICATQYLYLLYLASAYYMTFYIPHSVPVTCILLLHALQSFFITGIFGLWILHSAPIMLACQVSKKYIKNNYILFGSTFLLLIFGNYIMYRVYLHANPNLYTMLLQMAYNLSVFIIACIVQYLIVKQ